MPPVFLPACSWALSLRESGLCHSAAQWCAELFSRSRGASTYLVFHHFLHLSVSEWISTHLVSPGLDAEKSNKVMAPELTDHWGWKARKDATQEFHDQYGKPGMEVLPIQSRKGGERLLEREGWQWILAKLGGGDSRKRVGPMQKNGNVRAYEVVRVYIFNHTWCKRKKKHYLKRRYLFLAKSRCIWI